jgi:hypothetical protein
VQPIQAHEIDQALNERLEAQREEQVQAEADRRIEIMTGLGGDFPDGQIISFKKQFEVDGTEYTYVGVKINGSWYTTSMRDRTVYTWDGLKTFMVGGVVPTKEFKIHDDGFTRLSFLADDPTIDPWREHESRVAEAHQAEVGEEPPY